jgi:hypothetical protein
MRLSGAGRPLTFKDLDEQLAAWVRERRSNKLRVSRRLIQLQAERLFNAEEDDGDFKVGLPGVALFARLLTLEIATFRRVEAGWRSFKRATTSDSASPRLSARSRQVTTPRS